MERHNGHFLSLGIAPIVAAACAQAATMVAAFEWPGCWPAVLLSPLLLGWIAVAAPTRRAVTIVLLVQLATWLWICRWIIPITAAGYPFLSLYMALYPALLVWLVGRLARRTRWPMTILLPIVWTAVELLRGRIVLDGYPWFLLSHPLVTWPALVQTADLIGGYGVGFVAAMPSGAVLDVLGARTGTTRRSVAVVGVITTIAVVAASAGYGFWRLQQVTAVTAGPRVLVIQTDLRQDNKIGWTPQQQADDVPRFMALTRRAVAEAGGEVDLVVWPETMLPGIGFEPSTRRLLEQYDSLAPLRRWTDEVETLQRELGVPMLVGSLAWIDPRVSTDEEGSFLEREREHNSAYLLDAPAAIQRYDKVVLTPFGETMPYISSWPWLESKLLALGARGMSFSLDRARTPQILELEPGGGRLATPICFEDTVPALCRRMAYDRGAKRIDLLVNLSNDGWFGDHDVGRRNHVQIARLRCVENRVPMVRAVNTGLSVSIDSAGRLVDRLEPRREGWLLARTGVDERATLYGRIGDAWAWACLIAAGLLLLWTILIRRGADHDATD